MKFISYSPRICRKCKHIFRNRNKKTIALCKKNFTYILFYFIYYSI